MSHSILPAEPAASLKVTANLKFLLILLAVGCALVGAYFLRWGYYSGFTQTREVTAILPTVVWSSLTELGDIRCLLAFLLIFGRSTRDVLWAYLLAFGLAGLITAAVKAGFQMPRPGNFYPMTATDITPRQLTGSKSFTSSHAAMMFAMTGVLLIFSSKKWRVLIVGVGVVAALSRIALGAHWPMDVMGAALISFFSAYIAGRCWQRWTWMMSELQCLLLTSAMLLAVLSLLWVDVDLNVLMRLLLVALAALGMVRLNKAALLRRWKGFARLF